MFPQAWWSLPWLLGTAFGTLRSCKAALLIASCPGSVFQCFPQESLAGGPARGCPFPHYSASANCRDQDGFQGWLRGDGPLCCHVCSDGFVDLVQLWTAETWVLALPFRMVSGIFWRWRWEFFSGLHILASRPVQKGRKPITSALLAQLLGLGSSRACQLGVGTVSQKMYPLVSWKKNTLSA